MKNDDKDGDEACQKYCQKDICEKILICSKCQKQLCSVDDKTKKCIFEGHYAYATGTLCTKCERKLK